jgi:prophage regulatory protein
MSINTTLPETGYLRINQLIRKCKSHPPTPALFPFGKTTLWNKIKEGTFPAPIKPFGPRITVWSVEAIREYIASINQAD